MRIGLVSPYSWTYPGGVTRHIEALADRFRGDGHEVFVFAPYDPDDRTSARLHGGARPQARPVPEYLVPLGRTIGVRMNGAVSNLSGTPYAVTALRRSIEAARLDVIHVHEPVAPIVGWDVLSTTGVPLVGTFHCYGTNPVVHGIGRVLGSRLRLNHLHVRIAVSEAAAWTGRRFHGGEYRVIPNGVAIPAHPPGPKAPGDRLRIAFVGQAVERKGLPVLLRAFEALRDHVPAELDIVGAEEDEVAPLLLDARGVRVLGKVSDERRQEVVGRADVLCAPSLGGESFGMVLTEAFAAGTPVVASDIGGYRDVVRAGVDGVLFPRGDATELAEALRDLWHAPARRAAMAAEASRSAQRFAWPRVAGEVLEAYEDARRVPAPATTAERVATRVGVRSADGVRRRPRRMPRPEPAGHERRPAAVWARRLGLGLAAVVGLLLGGLALQRVGVHQILVALVDSSPPWVLAGLALMCVSMILRGEAWYAILRAVVPGARVRRSDAMQGTMIGVLMSATLPARLGEPSRALIVARRTGRPRESFPLVLGTIVSQTLLNIVALVLLGTTMFFTVGLFSGREGSMLLWMIAPIALCLIVLAAPALLRREGGARSDRVRRWIATARAALVEVRRGLRVFRHPREASVATVAQLSAWAVQWLSCYVLLVALGLDERAGLGAAAAVLFAVNVTAVLPATPSNLGVFQAACVAVLTAGYGVNAADALGYGIILQAVEIATAFLMGMPALVKEGLSWREVRLRAMHTAPVQLAARPRAARDEAEVEAA
ncbi:MAG TPA: lysylphosphatidylglycerol synthase domain-containing protein [Solirubrobacteraceae bacterium]|nr:lysylphosphatidylglycerol synthase domain-containing protein [Solirubrobacteraceae bacterium]